MGWIYYNRKRVDGGDDNDLVKMILNEVEMLNKVRKIIMPSRKFKLHQIQNIELLM
jgi:hypothetical protein